MSRELLQIIVATYVEAEEAVAALFERLFGQTPVLYTDEETLITQVSAYLESPRLWTAGKKAALVRGLAQLRAEGLALGPARLRQRRLRAESWVNAWKRHFRPLEIGGALLVKPTWSRRRAEPGQAVVTLDPGLSFGTGQHPTTLFCLGQVVASRARAHPPSLLDVGTGSGILAIAAAKLGYRPIVAFDFDPIAVKVARANARANEVAGQVRILRGDVRHPPMAARARFDVVCANLLADLLIAEAGRIAGRVPPEGRLILAGILAREFRPVQAAYEALGLELVRTRVDREWKSGAFRWTKHKDSLASVEHDRTGECRCVRDVKPEWP
jgi:ribosomal protein L11 methyltransferase